MAVAAVVRRAVVDRLSNSPHYQVSVILEGNHLVDRAAPGDTAVEAGINVDVSTVAVYHQVGVVV